MLVFPVLRRLCSRQSARVKHITQSKTDPGIRKLKELLQETGEQNQITEIDDLESDFMSVHKSHRDHVREMGAMREREKLLIVRQKYFKEKYPNFLTWYDKEQIRYLYNSDPEEWTVEKLSEGFPALPEVIQNIIKNKWTKKTQRKISNHDRSVVQNWTDFKQGKLNSLPKELKEHLQKFTNRALNFQPFEPGSSKEIIQETPLPIKGEFSEIIDSYQRLKNKNSTEMSAASVTGQAPLVPTKKLKKDSALLTFKELQERESRKKETSIQDKLLQEASLRKNEETIMELSPEDVQDIIARKNETNKVGFVKKTKDMSHLIYPSRINIPDDIYKKGCTYKLNDCYYDSDGEFLYRVPGMD